MKTIFILLVFSILGNTSLKAQEVGDFISCHFEDSKPYYARVLSVKDDIIEVTFVHSSSIYKFTKGLFFKDLDVGRNDAYKGEVVSNIGGKFGKGTPIYYCVINRKEEISASNRCKSKVAILEFDDGKQYVATTDTTNDSANEYTILHSGKKYKIDINTKEILSSDGTYKAGKILNKMTCTNYSNAPYKPIFYP